MRMMMQQNPITITRMTRTGDKLAYAALGTGFAYIKPMTEEQSSVNGNQYGQGFILLCDKDTDLRESDRVASEGITYTVRGVAVHSRGPHKFIKAIMVKTL